MTLLSLSAFSTHAQEISSRQLRKKIEAEFGTLPGQYALAFKNLQNNKTFLINKHEIFHAASTMKTPVLVEAYRQAAAGKFRLTDSITIVNSFKSIADSSLYSLSEKDDSELELYKHIGEKTTIYKLLYLMIIRSSNLATNMMIDLVGASNVTATAKKMGAKDVKVLRGVEDNKAFQQGLNNQVSAYGLMTVFEQIATGRAVNAESSKAMIDILLDQQFNDIIPALLPKDVKVAHKTGFITGIHHDSGIVFLPDGRKYVLVILSKGLTDEKGSVNMMAGVSRLIYDWVMTAPAQP